MRFLDDRLLLSASDLMRFVACRRATALDLRALYGEALEPAEDSEDAALLQAHGMAHEARYLDGLRAGGRRVVEIPREGGLTAAVAATREALAEGPDVVYQGAFLGGLWGGWSDFLERVDGASALGTFAYEVTDTKLKRRPDPKHVLQLALYADLLGDLQGRPPERAHLELGNGERVTLRLADYAAYARRARRRLEAFVADPPETRPVRVGACAHCRWQDHCEAEWRRSDSLFRVAGIQREQVAKLEAAGVTTMAALAAQEARVPRLAEPTRAKLREQARLQSARDHGGPPAFALREAIEGKGFARLPRPDPGDLFYDIEGDPYLEGGLEYLHGVWAADLGFRAFWAHDHAEEARALAALLDLFAERLAAHPAAHIYHYAPYEITALRRLTTRYGIGEARLDRWLREGRLVDLYAVVRGGLFASEPGYSIKDLEAFYDLERPGAVTSAGGSVVAYECWRESGDDAILREIEEYNRLDCLSTERLRDWLVGTVRPVDAPWPEPEPEAAEKEAEEDADLDGLRRLLDGAGLTEERRALLLALALFHRREKRPAWWQVFDRMDADTDELIEDVDCLGGLVAVGPQETVKSSVCREYAFPVQQTKLREASRAGPHIVVGDKLGKVTLERLDRRGRRCVLKIGKKALERVGATELPARTDVLPAGALDASMLEASVRAMIADQCGARAHRALDDLLSRSAPRLSPPRAGPVMRGDDPVAGTVAAVRALDASVLAVQGPPGTGKTYVAARAILALVREGRRVGIAANSHEAIGNVLMGCIDALEADDADIAIENVELAQKVSGVPDPLAPPYARIERVADNGHAALRTAQVVGGTAWLFARPEFEDAFDTLFVDEAGQVGLANLVAMARAARNLVLIGDPRQLPQVIQGAHPPPANLSCLDWLPGEDATVPADRGIFLATSRRMHPDVCAFVSEQVYEGRLDSHPDTERQRIAGAGALPETGAHFAPVAHEGNAQEAPEEIAAIRATIERLLGATLTERDGTARPLALADIIVVAPYNAQVNALIEALPEGTRVGTVDRFQGREAAVCLVSMTSSSAEDMPRGLDFLFSLNRLNVAVSRAKTLALVFASPRLLDAPCATLEDMHRVNAFCALAERSTIEWSGAWRQSRSRHDAFATEPCEHRGRVVALSVPEASTVDASPDQAEQERSGARMMDER